MLGYTVIRAYNKLLGITFGNVGHNCGRASRKISVPRHLCKALGMNEKMSIWMRFSFSQHVSLGNASMNRASALDKHEIFLRHLLGNPTAEITVGNKQNILFI